jgi:putative membrane protein
MSDLDDPRVFFAVERTLLAWNRTSLALMAFGFVIERSSYFVRLLSSTQEQPFAMHLAYWVGTAFVALGVVLSVVSTIQYRRVLRTLKPSEIPTGYFGLLGVYANILVALLGVALAVALIVH